VLLVPGLTGDRAALARLEEPLRDLHRSDPPRRRSIRRRHRDRASRPTVPRVQPQEARPVLLLAPGQAQVG
jgi:hypothetical protein